MEILQGWLNTSRRTPCGHFDARPNADDVSLLVIHNISLPPNQFGSEYVESFFAGKLDPTQHPFFESIYKMRVSSHLYIRRSGEIVQFVNFNDRAWHAGMSSFQGRTRCNDFSIGIELEGADNISYSDAQYNAVQRATCSIMRAYPNITMGRIVGHMDIAPGRKTDPGVAFNWTRYRQAVYSQINAENIE